MRIVSIHAIRPEEPDCPRDWRNSLGQILVAVKTDDGLVGYGVGGGGEASVHVIHTVLRDILIGQDPANVESLYDRMYLETMPYGRKGLAIMAISGVDLALWDLRGKAHGKSVAAVIRETTKGTSQSAATDGVDHWVPMYRTGPKDPAKAVREGYRAVKIGLPAMKTADIIAKVRTVREQIGPDTALMIDGPGKMKAEDALRLSEALEPYSLSWMEMPLRSDDLKGYCWLTARSPIPIAAGEHEYTSKTFAEWIEMRAVHILQPDIAWCGGMTEVVRIYQMAQKSGFPVRPHRGAEVWGLHAIAALDDVPLAESGRGWLHWVKGQPQPQNGRIRIAKSPGFGVEYDEQLT